MKRRPDGDEPAAAARRGLRLQPGRGRPAGPIAPLERASDQAILSAYLESSHSWVQDRRSLKPKRRSISHAAFRRLTVRAITHAPPSCFAYPCTSLHLPVEPTLSDFHWKDDRGLRSQCSGSVDISCRPQRCALLRTLSAVLLRVQSPPC